MTLLDHNWNTFAASLLVEVCRRFGSRRFFVSPGYRDAPLIAAVQSADVEVSSCIDERAAAYQALGWAKATGCPAVLICTSGTAGANYLPAVIEARTDHIPLLVITADRPFDLVFANAQQVMDQRQLFGRFVKQSLDFPAPSAQLKSQTWISYTRMLLENSVSDRPGPVHINLPFSAPLDPIDADERPSSADRTAAEAALGQLHFSPRLGLAAAYADAELDALATSLQSAERGLLVIGRLNAEDAPKVRALRDCLGWPVFADIGSGLKFESPSELPDLNLPQTRAWLDAYRPDCVLHLGKRLVSRHFDDRLKLWNPPAYWVLSDEENVQDPYHLPQRRQLRLGAVSVLSRLPQSEARWASVLQSMRRQLAKTPSPSFNFRDVAEAIRAVPGQNVFLGNSTAIRAFDSWCFESAAPGLRVAANRGVSGIEGLLATTLGLALAERKPWTSVLGDISMLHDLNSLGALAQSEAQVIVVLVNNAGGRIFETLPVQKHSWVKDPLMSTPHSFQFEGAAHMFGLPYVKVETAEEFGLRYREALASGRSTVIECLQAPEADLQLTRAFAAQELTL